jgi:hypothetical protein
MDYIISKWLMDKYIFPIGVSKFYSRLYTSRSCPKNVIKNLQPINPKLDLEISSCFIAPNKTSFESSNVPSKKHLMLLNQTIVMQQKFPQAIQCIELHTSIDGGRGHPTYLEGDLGPNLNATLSRHYQNHPMFNYKFVKQKHQQKSLITLQHHGKFPKHLRNNAFLAPQRYNLLISFTFIPPKMSICNSLFLKGITMYKSEIYKGTFHGEENSNVV